MSTEAVSEIKYQDECLHLVLRSGGQAGYQYIYREARSVYWDSDHASFRCSRPNTGLSYLELFRNIVNTARDCRIILSFPSAPAFTGLPDDAVQSISAEIGI